MARANRTLSRGPCRWAVAALLLLVGAVPAAAAGPITVSFRSTPVEEVAELISRKERVNIVLGKDVTGEVSLSLYEVSVEEALHAVADAVGCAVVRRRHGFVIVPAGAASTSENEAAGTVIRSFKVRYSDPEELEKVLVGHLSKRGSISLVEGRRMLVVEDGEEDVARIEAVLAEVDRPPQQILIEAKILEVTLDDSQALGLDWTALFSADHGDGRFGLQGFASPDATGFVAVLQDGANVDFVLNALQEKGCLQTLSTPKLRALEDEEASVIIGDRQGYKVTTTINQVTTESIEFLESGVILKVTPAVDHLGRIMLSVHPEVSTGTIDPGGIPSQRTTEVTTHLLAADGQTIFIGGLLKKQSSSGRAGIPFLSSIPLIGALFSSSEEFVVNTETVVLITPHLIDVDDDRISAEEARRARQVEAGLEDLTECPVE